jgi:hypothetical protein
VFCLYPEPEGRVSFVVCFVYIQTLKKECFLSFFCLLYPEPERKVGFDV